ncbi:MAG: hypothetical protein IT373_18680 [Polyangiaceae bacterium]|nr:hypothetical protein [Polyangiaceae bacterium]
MAAAGIAQMVAGGVIAADKDQALFEKGSGGVFLSGMVTTGLSLIPLIHGGYNAAEVANPVEKPGPVEDGIPPASADAPKAEVRGTGVPSASPGSATKDGGVDYREDAAALQEERTCSRSPEQGLELALELEADGRPKRIALGRTDERGELVLPAEQIARRIQSALPAWPENDAVVGRKPRVVVGGEDDAGERARASADPIGRLDLGAFAALGWAEHVAYLDALARAASDRAGTAHAWLVACEQRTGFTDAWCVDMQCSETTSCLDHATACAAGRPAQSRLVACLDDRRLAIDRQLAVHDAAAQSAASVRSLKELAAWRRANPAYPKLPKVKAAFDARFAALADEARKVVMSRVRVSSVLDTKTENNSYQDCVQSVSRATGTECVRCSVRCNSRDCDTFESTVCYGGNVIACLETRVTTSDDCLAYRTVVSYTYSGTLRTTATVPDLGLGEVRVELTVQIDGTRPDGAELDTRAYFSAAGNHAETFSAEDELVSGDKIPTRRQTRITDVSFSWP